MIQDVRHHSWTSVCVDLVRMCDSCHQAGGATKVQGELRSVKVRLINLARICTIWELCQCANSEVGSSRSQNLISKPSIFLWNHLEVESEDGRLQTVLMLDHWVVPQGVRIRLKSWTFWTELICHLGFKKALWFADTDTKHNKDSECCPVSRSIVR